MSDKRGRVVLVVAASLGLAAVAAVLLGVTARSTDSPHNLDCGFRSHGQARTDCYVAALLRTIDQAPNPDAAMRAVRRLTNADRGDLAARCHLYMHTVGRRFGAEHRVTLAGLMSYLPKGNDAACAAGFAHGVITHVAPQMDLAHPRRSARVCQRLATRYERYSCIHGFGHAFMRIHLDELTPALKLCTKLGKDAPDCAQGAYHDYWFAVVGEDDARRPKDVISDPRTLCSRQPEVFVRPCWYRAFIETRPSGYRTKRPDDLKRLCHGVDGLQRNGCITAASVIGSPNPLVQFRVCAALSSHDILSCLHGVKAQNLIGTPRSNEVRLIERCAWFKARTRTACYEWFGRVIAVVRDGKSTESVCSGLPARSAEESCRRGAKRLNEALVTFS